MMNKMWKEKWVAALRSGDYEQCAGKLHLKGDGFGCLGVLCDLVDKNRWKDYGGDAGAMTFVSIHSADNAMFIPQSVVIAVGLENGNPIVLNNDGISSTLSELNDDEGYDFNVIADTIEKQL